MGGLPKLEGHYYWYLIKWKIRGAVRAGAGGRAIPGRQEEKRGFISSSMLGHRVANPEPHRHNWDRWRIQCPI